MEKTKVTEINAFTALMVMLLSMWYFMVLYLMLGSFSAVMRHTESYIMLVPFAYLVIDIDKNIDKKIRYRYKQGGAA